LIAEDPKLRKWFDMKRLEGEEEGKEAGRAEGIAAMQGGIFDALNKRFPGLAEEAKPEIEHITSLDALRQLIVEIAVAQDEATARRALEAHLH
jgi:hypothetical protein